MQQKLLITDLDNTLYDWVTFFTASFRSMVTELTSMLETFEDNLLEEFKSIHQRYGNSEQPEHAHVRDHVLLVILSEGCFGWSYVSDMWIE
jgi:FMN phosphatase YigB (HAD superfamily)